MEQTFTTTTEFTGLLKPGLRHPRLLTHEDRARSDQFKVAQALLLGQLNDLIDDVRDNMLNDRTTQAHGIYQDAAFQLDASNLSHQICGEQIQEALWTAALEMQDIEITLQYESDDNEVSDVILIVDGVRVFVDSLNGKDRNHLTDLCTEHAVETQRNSMANDGWTASDLAALRPGVAS